MPGKEKSLQFRQLVGERIREFRLAQNLSLRGLAKRSGVMSQAISMIERGRVNARLDTFERLARGLGVEVLYLFNVAKGERAKFIEATRTMSPAHIRRIIDKTAGPGARGT